MANKSVLDWLREMSAAPNPRRREAQAGGRPQCKRVDPLFELPKRFGVYGCLEEVEGESYAVYSFSVKGMSVRYRLLYPAVLKWVERRRDDDIARRYDTLPQKLVDAALELATKHAVEVARECEYPGHCVSRLVVDGVKIDNRWICERVGADACVKRILEYVAENRAEAATV